MLRTLVLALLLCAAPCASLAQSPADAFSATIVDSLRQAGLRDGRTAAGQRPTSGHFLASFVGGLPVGFFGLIVVGEPEADLVPLMAVGAGLGTVFLSSAHAARTAEPPPAVMERIQEHDPEYQRAFRDAYTRRLQGRRVGASTLGGVAGTAVGFGALIYLLSQIGT